MIRVLHATMSFEPGGRREAISTLARHQQPMGVRPDLVSITRLGCEPEELNGTFDQHVALERQGLFDHRAISWLVRFCDEREIQIIHAHDAASQALAAFVRWRRPRINLLLTFHRSRGFDSARWRDRLRNSLATMACGAVVVGSRERQRHFLRENFVRRKKVLRIPFGIDLGRFRADETLRSRTRRELQIDDDTVLYGAVGHYGEEKGLDIVLQAYRELLRRLPAAAKVKLVVLGDGAVDRRQVIRDLAAAIPADRVTLTGFRNDVERWFNAMDIFVHTPRQEAFGLVTAEAMATRLPVVATAVGGVVDIVQNGESGLLVQSEDFNGVADAMHKFWLDNDLRDRMAARSEAIARTAFSAEIYAQRYLDIYIDLLAGRRPREIGEPASAGSFPIAAAAGVVHGHAQGEREDQISYSNAK